MIKRYLLFFLFLSLLVPAVHSGQPEVKVPQLKKALWQRPLLLDKDFEVADDEKVAKSWIDKGLEIVSDEPILPGFVPVVADKQKLVYRNPQGVRAVSLIAGTDDKEKRHFKAGDVHWMSVPMDGSLARILNHPDLRPTMENWLNLYFSRPTTRDILFENYLTGTLATSCGQVYVVDDLAIPRPGNVFPWMWQNLPARAKEYVRANSLQSFDLSSGKFKWRLGDDLGNDRRKEDEFTQSHFLGVPLPLGEAIYALNEKSDSDKGESEIRLVRLDPNKLTPEHRPVVVPPILSLGKVSEHLRITHNLARRISSVELVQTDKVLVCPTHAGKVFGVNLEKMTIRWTYTYKEDKNKPAAENLPPFFQFNREWRIPGIFLHQERLVFAAPDEGSVHCIRVKDGKLLWKSPRKDGLYVSALFGDKVLVVGNNNCWALALEDGKEMWTIETGFPSGKGASQGNFYYLPLRKSASSGKRGISLIDIAKGKILQTVGAADGKLPGNLLIHQDMLISQSATHIAAYPLRAGKK